MSELRLHVDDDRRVWWGDARRSAKRSELTSDEFVRQDVVHEAVTLRLFGTPGNAELLWRLHLQRARREQFGTVWVHNPQGCRPGTPASAALRQLWQPGLPQAIDQQAHVFSAAEYPAYLLVDEMLRRNHAASSATFLLAAHPAWTAASFLGCSTPHRRLGLAKLLAAVGDPRWFRDPARPNRLNRLLAHLGLGGWQSTFDHKCRAAAVRTAWGGDEDDCDDVHSILCRILGPQARDAGGLRRVDRFFVRFLNLVWLQRLSPERMVFKPEQLLKRDDEREAWKSCGEAV